MTRAEARTEIDAYHRHVTDSYIDEIRRHRRGIRVELSMWERQRMIDAIRSVMEREGSDPRPMLKSLLKRWRDAL